jgi:uncharacterized Zn finger protein (UPF0148 family)
MNIAGGMEGEGIVRNLKYCERCGALWVRAMGGTGVYCAVCQGYFAARPNVSEAHPQPRRARRRKVRTLQANRSESVLQIKDPLQGQIDCLYGVGATEVRL